MRSRDVRGLKYVATLQPLLERLHDAATARDRAGNRQLLLDRYLTLLLLYFFSPVLTSLRALQQAGRLDKVRQFVGVAPSLGALSEAARVFDAQLLRSVVHELARQAVPLEQGPHAEALRGLTAVDGSVLPALPRMVWALGCNATRHAAKLHLHFDILKGVPCDAEITPAAGSESARLRGMLQPDRFYVLDRGYANYDLLRDLLAVGSSFVLRVKDNTGYGLQAERPIDDQARAAGVVRDLELLRLGVLYGREALRQPLRLVVIRRPKPDGGSEELWLVTDRLDLPADLIALVYRYRWTVELFFRWFKCILGCRHLLAENANGVALQCYAALIASLLVVLWTGRKPNRRTWEMIQFYLLGWASEEELAAHLDQRGQ
jgi:hypothetical protein